MSVSASSQRAESHIVKQQVFGWSVTVSALLLCWSPDTWQLIGWELWRTGTRSGMCCQTPAHIAPGLILLCTTAKHLRMCVLCVSLSNRCYCASQCCLLSHCRLKMNWWLLSTLAGVWVLHLLTTDAKQALFWFETQKWQGFFFSFPLKTLLSQFICLKAISWCFSTCTASVVYVQLSWKCIATPFPLLRKELKTFF